MDDIKTVKEQFLQDLTLELTIQDVENLRVKYLGKRHD